MARQEGTKAERFPDTGILKFDTSGADTRSERLVECRFARQTAILEAHGCHASAYTA